jgi:hypothetical protein
VLEQLGSVSVASEKDIDKRSESLKKATIYALDVEFQILRIEDRVKQDMNSRAMRLLQLDEGLLKRLKGKEEAILAFFVEYAEQIKEMLQNTPIWQPPLE